MVCHDLLGRIEHEALYVVSSRTLSVQGTVTDTAGKVNLPVSPLSFKRVSYPLLAGTSYQVLKAPGLLTLTR